jgi:hypothetical protein
MTRKTNRLTSGRRIAKEDWGSEESSNVSNIDGKTYSSSISPPLVQIASYKFGPSTDDSMTALSSNSNHKYSVVIHDHADIESLTHGRQALPCKVYGKIDEQFLVDRVPSMRRAFKFNGKKGKNKVGTLDVKKGKAALSGPTSRKQPMTSNAVAPKGFQMPADKTGGLSQRPSIHRGPQELQRAPQDEDALDRVFTTLEKWTCDDGIQDRNEIDATVSTRKQEIEQEALMQAWEKRRGPYDDFMKERATTCKDGYSKSNSKTPIDKRQHISEGLVSQTSDSGKKTGLARTGGSESSGSRSRETRSVVPTKATRHNKPNADFLDYTFDEQQQATLHAADTGPPMLCQEKDYLDTVFEGVESATCRPEPRIPSRPTRKVTTRGVSQPQGKAQSVAKEIFHRTQNSSSLNVEQRDDVDALDSFWNGVEYCACRERGVGLRPQGKPDLLDSVCEPFAPGGTKNGGAIKSIYDTDQENSILGIIEDDDEYRTVQGFAGGSRDWIASNVKEKRSSIATQSNKTPTGDILDYVFENVESRLCQPRHDDLSLASAMATRKRR